MSFDGISVLRLFSNKSSISVHEASDAGRGNVMHTLRLGLVTLDTSNDRLCITPAGRKRLVTWALENEILLTELVELEETRPVTPILIIEKPE